MKIKTTGRVVAWLVTGFSGWAKFVHRPDQVKTGAAIYSLESSKKARVGIGQISPLLQFSNMPDFIMGIQAKTVLSDPIVF